MTERTYDDMRARLHGALEVLEQAEVEGRSVVLGLCILRAALVVDDDGDEETVGRSVYIAVQGKNTGVLHTQITTLEVDKALYELAK